MVVAHKAPAYSSHYHPDEDVLRAEPKLWAHVERGLDENPHIHRACWIWRGPIRDNGTALVRTSRRDFPVHTLAWLLRAAIPSAVLVPRPYRCDERWCVRFEHLALQPRQNTRSASAQRREAIYLLYHPISPFMRRMTYEEIGARFQLTPERVGQIIREEQRRIERGDPQADR